MKQIDDIVLELPLPPSSLRGNSRSHWAKKNRDFQNLKTHVVAEVISQDIREIGWKQANTSAIFFFADKRGYKNDPDNLSSSLKAVWDGLQSSGVIDNDRNFTHWPIQIDVDRDRPRLVVYIWPMRNGN
jgi:Holliday junction resolvase RusA-like endonuclease